MWTATQVIYWSDQKPDSKRLNVASFTNNLAVKLTEAVMGLPVRPKLSQVMYTGTTLVKQSTPPLKKHCVTHSAFRTRSRTTMTKSKTS